MELFLFFQALDALLVLSDSFHELPMKGGCNSKAKYKTDARFLCSDNVSGTLFFDLFRNFPVVSGSFNKALC